MSSTNKDDIITLPLPEGMTRMESGPVRIGEGDWPGYFLRGDNAFNLIGGLDWLEGLIKEAKETGTVRFSTELMVEAAFAQIKDMKRCILGVYDNEDKPLFDRDVVRIRLAEITQDFNKETGESVSEEELVAMLVDERWEEVQIRQAFEAQEKTNG